MDPQNRRVALPQGVSFVAHAMIVLENKRGWV
jgi:hypothetical protein